MQNPNHRETWRDIGAEGFLNARAECAKHGFNLSEDFPTTRSEALKERADLRRAINKVRDDADQAIKDGKNDRANELMGTIRTLSLLVDGLSEQIDLDDAAAAQFGHKTASGWRTAEGKPVDVIERGDKVANGGSYDGPSFGEAVKAMALGTRNPDVRAALSEGSDASGGYTVPDKLLREIIDAMRARQVAVRAGARTVMLDTEKTSIARIDSDPVAAWRLENGSITESDPTFGRIQFQARSLAVLVKVSREVFEDSLNLDEALMAAFAGSMAVELDRVSLFGSGTAPEPLGIYDTTGIGEVDMGTDGAALDSYEPFIDAIQLTQEANAADPTAAVMSPRTSAALGKLVDTTGQPLRKPDAVQALPFMTTATVPNDLGHGTAADASTILVGDFRQLLLGIRSELRIEMLRELFAENHQYGFVAHLRADVAVAQPGAFAKITGVIPTA